MKIIVDNFFTILLIMNILLSFIIVFRERKETAQTWAWLLVLMFIPVVGFILYIFLGRGISKEKIFDFLQYTTRIGPLPSENAKTQPKNQMSSLLDLYS